MDYHFAKSEFEGLLAEINELLKNDELSFTEADPLAQKTGVYIKNLFETKDEERKAYQRNFNRNEEINRLNSTARLTDCKKLIETILVDINQNIRKRGNEGNQNKLLQDQLNVITKELENADNEKANFQKQIQNLESELKKERTQLGMYSKTVEDQERQRRNEINDKIKQHQNNLILLQTKVNGLKADKARLEDLLKATNSNKNDSAESTIVHHDDEGKPLTLKALISSFVASEKTNRSTQRTLEETSRLFEQSKQQNSDWDNKYHKQAKDIEKLQTRLSEVITENRQLKEQLENKPDTIKKGNVVRIAVSETQGQKDHTKVRLALALKTIVYLFLGYVMATLPISSTYFQTPTIVLFEFVLFIIFLISFAKPYDALLQIITLLIAILGIAAMIIIPQITQGV